MSNLIKRILSSIILLPISFYLIISGFYTLVFFTTICFFVSSYEWYMMTKNKLYTICGLIFLIFTFYIFYQMSINNLDGVLFVILICISTDIGGYVFGKIFKGPKLTKISPNKTYAGMIGGFFLSLISFMILTKLNNNFDITIQLLLIIILLSATSQIGDIIISYFKRLSKIKNTGNLIPGHGGLLDRIDGMIFTFPIFYLVKLLGY